MVVSSEKPQQHNHLDVCYCGGLEQIPTKQQSAAESSEYSSSQSPATTTLQVPLFNTKTHTHCKAIKRFCKSAFGENKNKRVLCIVTAKAAAVTTTTTRIMPIIVSIFRPPSRGTAWYSNPAFESRADDYSSAWLCVRGN